MQHCVVVKRCRCCATWICVSAPGVSTLIQSQTWGSDSVIAPINRKQTRQFHNLVTAGNTLIWLTLICFHGNDTNSQCVCVCVCCGHTNFLVNTHIHNVVVLVAPPPGGKCRANTGLSANTSHSANSVFFPISISSFLCSFRGPLER